MANDVLSVLRGQLLEAEDQVRRLQTAISALEGAGVGSAGRRRGGTRTSRGRPRKAATMVGRKKRRFSAATRAKMAAAQRARWAKRKKAEG